MQLPDTHLTTVAPSAKTEYRLSFRKRFVIRWILLSIWVKERMLFDSPLVQKLIALFGLSAAWMLGIAGRSQRGFAMLCKIHRANYSMLANRYVERLIRDANAATADHPLLHVYLDHVERIAPTPATAKFFSDPERLLKSMAIVLKSSRPGEKGVVVLLYSNSLRLFARLFDLHRVAERYYLVLEPDWCGFCDLNILSYARFPFPIFIQTSEPRDAQFLTKTCPNLVVVPIGNNWWIDHRLFSPAPDEAKDIDVVMNAGWGQYKRHAHFFAALRKLKESDYALRTLLVGYPIGLSRDDILQLAGYYGIEDQLEVHEWIPYEQMNSLLRRAKVGVLWSRKEGSNRAIIEMMLAGIPCILREGHNFGHRYAYINPQTGCYASEAILPERLLELVKNYRLYTSREWVLSNMTPRHAVDILSKTIGRVASERGEKWTEGLIMKVNRLHRMEYWNPDEDSQFDDDYAFLRSVIRV